MGVVLGTGAFAQTPLSRPIIFPSKGQSAEQQATDETFCYGWAKNYTGFDPAQALAELHAQQERALRQTQQVQQAAQQQANAAVERRRVVLSGVLRRVQLSVPLRATPVGAPRSVLRQGCWPARRRCVNMRLPLPSNRSSNKRRSLPNKRSFRPHRNRSSASTIERFKLACKAKATQSAINPREMAADVDRKRPSSLQCSDSPGVGAIVLRVITVIGPLSR